MKKQKIKPRLTTPDDPHGGDILPWAAPGPSDPSTKLFANKYTNEDSMLWQ